MTTKRRLAGRKTFVCSQCFYSTTVQYNGINMARLHTWFTRTLGFWQHSYFRISRSASSKWELPFPSGHLHARVHDSRALGSTSMYSSTVRLCTMRAGRERIPGYCTLRTVLQYAAVGVDSMGCWSCGCRVLPTTMDGVWRQLGVEWDPPSGSP